MEASHIFDLKGSHAFGALETLVASRWSMPDEMAATEQRAFERDVLTAVLKLGAEIVGADLTGCGSGISDAARSGPALNPADNLSIS
jgi:hypothetical protein